MQYATLIYLDPAGFDSLTPEEAQAVSAEYHALSDDPRCVGGAQLQPADLATTVRVRDGQTLTTDGPFAETKEVFGGFYLLDAPDIDGALEFAARIPTARMGGSVEVRPLVER